MFVSERIEDEINKKVAEQMNLSLSIIEKLNTFQWKIILEATHKFSDIEVTGLARIKTKKKIIKSNIEKYNDKIYFAEQKKLLTDNEKIINSINKRIEVYKENIIFLQSKENV